MRPKRTSHVDSRDEFATYCHLLRASKSGRLRRRARVLPLANGPGARARTSVSSPVRPRVWRESRGGAALRLSVYCSDDKSPRMGGKPARGPYQQMVEHTEGHASHANG